MFRPRIEVIYNCIDMRNSFFARSNILLRFFKPEKNKKKGLDVST